MKKKPTGVLSRRSGPPSRPFHEAGRTPRISIMMDRVHYNTPTSNFASQSEKGSLRILAHRTERRSATSRIPSERSRNGDDDEARIFRRKKICGGKKGVRTSKKGVFRVPTPTARSARLATDSYSGSEQTRQFAIFCARRRHFYSSGSCAENVRRGSQIGRAHV